MIISECGGEEGWRWEAGGRMPGLPSALFNIMEGGDLLVSFVCNKVLNIALTML